MTGVTVEQWYETEPPFGYRYEVVGGELVATPIGENPHQQVSRGFLIEFLRQWPDADVTAPGNWVLESLADGRVVSGRLPDVLVVRNGDFDNPSQGDVPLAAVEIWSPGNRRAERERKRREYRAAGLPIMVEVWIRKGEVQVDWHVQLGPRWILRAQALGDETLTVDGERPFRVVPNELLRRPQLK